jgi:hypothetical protein
MAKTLTFLMNVQVCAKTKALVEVVCVYAVLDLLVTSVKKKKQEKMEVVSRGFLYISLL